MERTYSDKEAKLLWIVVVIIRERKAFDLNGENKNISQLLVCKNKFYKKNIFKSCVKKNYFRGKSGMAKQKITKSQLKVLKIFSKSLQKGKSSEKLSKAWIKHFNLNCSSTRTNFSEFRSNNEAITKFLAILLCFVCVTNFSHVKTVIVN